MGSKRPTLGGVLFDFGDTLLHEGPNDFNAGAEAVLAKASDPGGVTVDRLAGALRDLMADLDPRRRASWIELPVHTVWRLVYEPLGIRFSAPPEEIEWTFWNAATSWTRPPGIIEVLAELERRGIPAAVVSNSMFRGEVISRQLAESGIGRGLRWIMTSCEHVVRKPDPRIFALAAARLDRAPQDIWFLGDSYELDMLGAAGAGMRPIWYRPGASAAEPAPRTPVAAEISGWPDFLRLLEVA